MLETIPDLPDYVVGLKATGKVEANDYRSVLMPAVEARLERQPRVRLLYVLGDGFDGFTGGAAWEDAKVGMTHFTHFERVAVVTDDDLIEGLVKAFGFVLPGEVRLYDTGELEDAREWISETPSAGKLDFEFLRDSRVLVLEPKDQLEVADFARVAAEIDPVIEEAGGLAGIVIVAPRFPGWDDFAAFTSHFEFVRRHHDKIRRLALVTEDRFLSALPRLASRFVEAEVRRFPVTERDAALLWVGEAGGDTAGTA